MKRLAVLVSAVTILASAPAWGGSAVLSGCTITGISHTFHLPRESGRPDAENIEKVAITLNGCKEGGRNDVVIFARAYPELGTVKSPYHLVPEGVFSRWVKLITKAMFAGKKVSLEGEPPHAGSKAIKKLATIAVYE